MKKFLIIVAVGAVGYAGIHYAEKLGKIQDDTVITVTTVEAENQKSENPPDSPKIQEKNNFPTFVVPKKADTVENSVSPVANLPPNQFILIVYKSVETNDGIKGFPPGTILIAKNKKEFAAPDGNVLTLDPAEYTNDVATALKYISADRLGQIKTRAALGATPPPVNLTPPIQTPPEVAPTTPIPRNPPVAGNPLDKGGFNRGADANGVRTDENGRKYKIIKGQRVYGDW